MTPIKSAHVIITMAGLSSRFQAEGFKTPKYRLIAKNQSLLSWSLNSLKGLFDLPFIFVVRSADGSRDFISQTARSLALKDFSIIELDITTKGQAHTALIGGQSLPDNDPLFIYNIDTHIDPAGLDFTEVRGDGWIPCFKAEGDHWSFAATCQSTGQVIEVAEKRRISDFATVGLYYFGSWNLFRGAYDAMYRSEGPEQFVAPLYNYLIKTGGKVYISELPNNLITPLGTPKEVSLFDPAFTMVNFTMVNRT